METETEKVFTRQQRLNNECTHEQYWGQFVTGEHRLYVKQRFGIEKLKSAFEQDKNLNTIPLDKWDGCWGIGSPIPFMILAMPMKDVSDYLTPAGIVCILKEAARQIVKEPENDNSESIV